MTELFKLLGIIAIDNSEAKEALAETSSEGSKAESKLSSAFSKIGGAAVKVGKAIVTGLAVAGTAVATLVGSSIAAYADYEQLVGGVETLFKNSASQVQEYAKNAYKTAGLSANEYMETVTGFSAALLQSLGGDTDKAAKYADMAITDMSDNANKMGSDIETIKTAYQGFAKQNYTMLDNLKLGYGGTKEEMQRLLEDAEKLSGVKYDISSYADIVDAIHVVQTEMGITGTTAKEAASTISGSLASMKGSWQNLLVAISSDDLPFDEYINSFVDSVSTFADNILPRIEIALNGVVTLVQQLAPKIISALPSLLNALLPAVIGAATSLIESLAGAFPALMGVLLNCIPDLLNAVQSIFSAIVEALPSLVESIASALPTLIPQLIDAVVSMITILASNFMQIVQPIINYLPSIIISIVTALANNLPILIEGFISLVMGIVQALPQIIQSLVDAIPQIVSMIVTALLENLPALIIGCVQLVMGLVTALPQIFSALWEGVVGIFTGIWEAIQNVFAPVGEWFSNLWNSLKENPSLTTLCTTIENIWTAVKDVISAVVSAIKDVVFTVWNAIKDNISAVLGAIQNVVSTVWNSIKNVVSTVINSVKDVISTVWNAIKTIIANVMNIIFSVIQGDWTSVKESVSNIVNAIQSVISSVWNAIKNVISSVMSGIRNTISSVWNGIKSVVSSVVNGIKNTVSSVFNSIKSVTTSVWNGVKTAMTTPIEAAKNKIKSIVDTVKGFFKGMKLDFPNIKLPHFSVKPKGWHIDDLLKGKIPKLGIEWYAKAMDSPMIMTQPTIFGYNAATGQLLGGGEAGSEVVSGTQTLMNLISAAVSSQNQGLTDVLYRILEAILSMDENMGGNLREALAGTAFEVDKREFGRLVKAVN